jgi:hypothetical protein
MNEHDDVICQVRESFSGLRMDVPVETVFARSRIRRRRRISGLTAAAAVTAGAAAAITVTLAGPAPARSVTPPSASPRPARLAAFSVTSGPGGSTTLVLHKGEPPDPNALRQALAQHGIPALVTVNTFCVSTPGGSASFSKLVQAANPARGTALVINLVNGQGMPAETKLSIGYFPNYFRTGLIEDGAPLSCSSRQDKQ